MQLSISACVIRMVAMDAGRDTDKWTWDISSIMRWMLEPIDRDSDSKISLFGQPETTLNACPAEAIPKYVRNGICGSSVQLGVREP